MRRLRFECQPDAVAGAGNATRAAGPAFPRFRLRASGATVAPMTARNQPAMRRLALTALLLSAACAQQAPIPVTYVPATPAPAAAGTPEERAARRLDSALQQDTRRDRARDADPYAGSMAGTPTPGTNLEIGGGDAPQTTPQIGIPFR
jgi:hypothetical protein